MSSFRFGSKKPFRHTPSNPRIKLRTEDDRIDSFGQHNATLGSGVADCGEGLRAVINLPLPDGKEAFAILPLDDAVDFAVRFAQECCNKSESGKSGYGFVAKAIENLADQKKRTCDQILTNLREILYGA